MNKTSVLLGVILITGIISMTYLHTDIEAKKKVYKYNIKVTLRGTPECVSKMADEVYFRLSDGEINEQHTGNLIVKGEKENLVIKKTPFVVTFSGKFDPKRIKDGNIREYIEVHKNGVETADDYKRPWTKFDPKRTSYSFSHGVNFGCE